MRGIDCFVILLLGLVFFLHSSQAQSCSRERRPVSGSKLPTEADVRRRGEKTLPGDQPEETPPADWVRIDRKVKPDCRLRSWYLYDFYFPNFDFYCKSTRQVGRFCWGKCPSWDYHHNEKDYNYCLCCKRTGSKCVEITYHCFWNQFFIWEYKKWELEFTGCDCQ